MKKLCAVMFSLVLALSGLYAAGFSKKGTAGDLEVEYYSAKPLAQGMNMINVKITDKGQVVSDAKVNVTVSMPAMPGMPAMESKSEAMPMNGEYMAHVTFSMNGTWQVSIEIETKDGKKQRLKSSVNL